MAVRLILACVMLFLAAFAVMAVLQVLTLVWFLVFRKT